MAELEKVGVEGVFETDKMEKGWAEYEKIIHALTEQSRLAATQTTDAFKKMDDTLGKSTPKIKEEKDQVYKLKDSLNKPGQGLSSALKEVGSSALTVGGEMFSVLGGASVAVITGGIALVAGGLLALTAGAVAATGAFIALEAAAIPAKAREEELGLAAQYMGQLSGLSATQVSDLIDQLENAGAIGDVASESIAKFSQHNIDASKAVDLFKIAQGASIITGKDAQETYLGLIDSITSLRTRSLKEIGILVDSTKANEAYAAQLGITKEELTEDQQAQALLNATLDAGKNLPGLYAEGMKLPAAQLRELTGTLIPELMDSLGAPFQEAFGTVIGMFANLVKALTAALNEGGVFYDWMVKLGAIASLVADGLAQLAQLGINAINEFAGTAATTISQVASDAFTWGVNIAVEIANGIIEGASSAIIAAMDFVGSMLSEWLSPGSPPKVAPDIDKWGMAAIGQWMEGMTSADFSALSAIEGPLGNALKLVMKDTGDAMADLMGPIMGAVESGVMSPELFDQISKAAGDYGEQLAILTRDEVALAAAEKKSTEAQKALTEAQKQSDTAASSINALTREYNDMLRHGASKQELDAKMAQIRAAEKQKTLADQAVVKAKTDSEEAQNKLGILKEQSDLQSKLVQQMLSLAKATETANAAAEKPSVGGGGAAKPKSLGPMTGGLGKGFDTSGLENKMQEAVDKMKQKIIDGLRDAFKPVTDAWTNNWGPTLDNLSARFSGFVSQIQSYWPGIQSAGSDAVLGITTTWTTAVDGLAAFIKPILDTLQTWWKDHGDSVMTIVNVMWQGIINEVGISMAGIQSAIAVGGEIITAFWDNWGKTITDLWNRTWGLVGEILSTYLDNIGILIDMVADVLTGKWGKLGDDLQSLWSNTWTLMTDVLSNKWNNIQEIAGTAVDNLIGLLQAPDWGSIGSAIIDAVRDGVLSAAQGLADAAAAVAKGAIDAVKGAIGMHSPPKVFTEIGEAIPSAMAASIDQYSYRPANALQNMTARSIAPTAMIPALAGASMNSVTMNMGGVSINGPMDEAILEARMTRIIRRAMGI